MGLFVARRRRGKELESAKMPMKILGAGFGRTGTFSLKRALETLGFGPCHHMYEVRQRPDQVELWMSAATGQKPDWSEAFKGFQSQVDWPASAYWKELHAHFPQAKVILTDRDPEAWYESIRQTILPASEIGRHADANPIGRKASEMMYKTALLGIFEGRLQEKDFAIQRMLDHRQEVIDTIPPEQLLVFGVGDGWEPLCRFLSVPEPDGPFPSGNSVKDFRALKPYLEQSSG